MSDRPVNFNPGPAILPLSVLEKASKEDAEKAKAQLEEAGASVELK